MLWAIVLVIVGVFAVNYGMTRVMEDAVGRGESWDMATRRASSALENLGDSMRGWLPVIVVLISAIVAPESRRNGTTQFALSCGVRRGSLALAQYCALAIVVTVMMLVLHVGIAVAGLRTGAITPAEAAISWVGLLVPVLMLSASVFCWSLTASIIETYLVLLGIPFVVQIIPSVVHGLPRWLPRLLVRVVDNFGLLFPNVGELIPWPHLSYGAALRPPQPEWHWAAVHFCAVTAFWMVLGLWRHRRHDFGSRTAVK
jgi:hypothetical protein